MKHLLRNLSVKASLTAVLGIFTAAIILITVLGFIASNNADKALKELNQVNVEQLNAINLTRAHLSDVQLNLIRYVDAVGDGEQTLAKTYLTEAQAAMQRATHRYDQYVAAPKTELGLPHAEAIQSAYAKLVTNGLSLQKAAIERDDIAAFRALRPDVESAKKAFQNTTQAFIDYAEARGHTLIADLDKQAKTFLFIEIGILALIAAIVVLVRMGMVRTLVHPLQEAVEHFDHIARGDLSHTIADRGRNEIGKLFAAMKNMQDGLTRTVSTVRDSSSSIHIGAREIASGNNDLSSRTEQQASSLEETAASMEQLTATVRQNADNARQGSTLASDASTSAGRGGEVVEQVITTMHGISESSRKVVDIIGVIDSIAFQTNILALNASVEAARAGEQGRGFAVVAGEVRNLASRSAEAAKEIKALIENSAAQIQRGSNLVESAGDTMREVVSSVRRVTDIMDEISSASQEQSTGIEQVNLAISQMDQVTQQNAALVQEAAAATAALEEQAEQLETAVALFRLNRSDSQRTTPRLSKSHAAPVKSATMSKSVSAKPIAQTKKAELEWEEF